MSPDGDRDRVVLQTAAVTPKARISNLLRDCSIEISARDPLSGELLRDHFPTGSVVYVNCTPKDTYHDIIAAAARLRRAGFECVPHVVARSLMSYTQLIDYLARLRGEAGVSRALVVAGDPERPLGPFETSLQLLETGLFESHAIRRVGFAGYPEGHPRITSAELDKALRAKLALARQRGLEADVVTQFVFEAQPIVDWVRNIRAQGIDVAVRVGVAGPASVATLAKYAVRCGIGNSLRALGRGHASLARLLKEVGPERLIHALASADDTAANSTAGIDSLHFFTFGGVARTCARIDAIVRSEFAMTQDGTGFHVEGS